MKDIYILGIESSCDETSCSIVKNGREEIATSTSTQISIHENFGGVVPEIASRERNAAGNGHSKLGTNTDLALHCHGAAHVQEITSQQLETTGPVKTDFSSFLISTTRTGRGILRSVIGGKRE